MNKLFWWWVIGVFLGVIIVGGSHLLPSTRAREVETSIMAPTTNIIKEMVVVNFLKGEEITRSSAWWLNTPNNLRMTEVELLLQSTEVSDLVPGESSRAKMVALHELLYHEFVVQRLGLEAPDNITIEPAEPITAQS